MNRVAKTEWYGGGGAPMQRGQFSTTSWPGITYVFTYVLFCLFYFVPFYGFEQNTWCDMGSSLKLDLFTHITSEMYWGTCTPHHHHHRPHPHPPPHPTKPHNDHCDYFNLAWLKFGGFLVFFFSFLLFGVSSMGSYTKAHRIKK